MDQRGIAHGVPCQRRAAPASCAGVNLANFLRTLALPDEIAQWSLTTLREKVVKIEAKIVAHGRSSCSRRGAVVRELLRGILHRIARLRSAAVARC
jgi:hypothetical protein